jgi:hypothetical protein
MRGFTLQLEGSERAVRGAIGGLGTKNTDLGSIESGEHREDVRRSNPGKENVWDYLEAHRPRQRR